MLQTVFPESGLCTSSCCESLV
uniref:Uncharacterized protein n=1 Tax=Anguilla anguilla TaxID=7936 RepID=A0A0E9W352_ANGAN